MKLLLHVCCSPDATTAYLRLKDKFKVDFYFYNPNIHPKEEYIKRLDAAKKLSNIWNVKLIEGEYIPERFFEAVKGLEHLGEMSERCYFCIKERLFQTASMARKLGYSYFSTSLPTSPKKDLSYIERAGKLAEKAFGVKFYVEDFKKDDGYPLSVKLSKELGLYRQNYCGCIFSLKEANEKRERSKQKRLEILKELAERFSLNIELTVDPEEFTVNEGLLNKLGMENFSKLVQAVRPRKLIVSKSMHEKFWDGRKNAKFGKFKVKILVLEEAGL